MMRYNEYDEPMPVIIGTDNMEGYKDMVSGEDFIYEERSFGKYNCIKVNEKAALMWFANGGFRVIIARVFKNCLSIGNSSIEFSSVKDAIEYIEKYPAYLDSDNFMGYRR